MDGWHDRLVEEFESSGMSEFRFANRVTELGDGVRGSSYSGVRNYLRDPPEQPRKELLRVMARVLVVNEDYLLFGSGDRSPADSVVTEASQRPSGDAQADARRFAAMKIDDSNFWPSEAVEAIATSGAEIPLSSASIVRAGFYDLLLQAVTSPASGLPRTLEGTVDMAAYLDYMILLPVRLFYPAGVPSTGTEPVRSYLTGVLHSLRLLVPTDDRGGRFFVSEEPEASEIAEGESEPPGDRMSEEERDEFAIETARRSRAIAAILEALSTRLEGSVWRRSRSRGRDKTEAPAVIEEDRQVAEKLAELIIGLEEVTEKKGGQDGEA